MLSCQRRPMPTHSRNITHNHDREWLLGSWVALVEMRVGERWSTEGDSSYLYPVRLSKSSHGWRSRCIRSASLMQTARRGFERLQRNPLGLLLRLPRMANQRRLRAVTVSESGYLVTCLPEFPPEPHPQSPSAQKKNPGHMSRVLDVTFL